LELIAVISSTDHRRLFSYQQNWD